MKKIKDYYYKKAKDEKYLARSVYKLIEIDQKYHLLRKSQTVLDVGCTPGSWSQYMLKKTVDGKVVGIDIDSNVRISDSRFSFINKDIHSVSAGTIAEKVQRGVKTTIEHAETPRLFDLIASDAAPETTGNRFLDSQQSLMIVRRVFEVAQTLLKPHGSIIAKVFQGEDVADFIRELKSCYTKVHLFKPASSRSESREVFIIAIRRRGKE